MSMRNEGAGNQKWKIESEIIHRETKKRVKRMELIWKWKQICYDGYISIGEKRATGKSVAPSDNSTRHRYQ